MKKKFTKIFLAIIACGLLSCSGNEKQSKELTNSTTETVTDSTNIKIILKNFEYFNKHDWASKAMLFAETATFLDPAYGKEKVTRNRQQMIEKYSSLEKNLPDIRDEIKVLHASGNIVVAEIISHGTLPGGSDLNLPICIVYRIENGLIVEDHTYYDN
jgi:ketosteroid isomerase-like protein